MNISVNSCPSGVDRHIESLLSGMIEKTEYEIIWLNLQVDSQLVLHKEEKNKGYRKIIIPFPEEFQHIINKQFWSEKYFHVVTEIITRYFLLYSVSIVHIHTLNLADFALMLKEEYGCKVITHVHYIAWKNLINTNKELFKRIYYEYYIKNNYKQNLFLSNISEEHSYLSVDKIICVTECGRNIIHNITQIPKEEISVISNGIKDYYDICHMQREIRKKGNRLLFVGGYAESKGLSSILIVMDRLFLQGRIFELIVVGEISNSIQYRIKMRYTHLNIKFAGKVNFEDLKKYYEWADIGCIASLQEQCSYVAIEMAMFGLPIITSSVDGLDEMFEDEVSALKVRTIYDQYIGLRIDEDQYAQAVIRLSHNRSLRTSLSRGARKRYLSKFKLSEMVYEITNIYNELI